VIEFGKISPLRSCRFRFDDRPLNKCRLLDLFRFNLPVPVTRTRLRTLLLVFCFGIRFFYEMAARLARPCHFRLPIFDGFLIENRQSNLENAD
jgi:hypothetical protein